MLIPSHNAHQHGVTIEVWYQALPQTLVLRHGYPCFHTSCGGHDKHSLLRCLQTKENCSTGLRKPFPAPLTTIHLMMIVTFGVVSAGTNYPVVRMRS
jgi:hypothetical protein